MADGEYSVGNLSVLFLFLLLSCCPRPRPRLSVAFCLSRSSSLLFFLSSVHLILRFVSSRLVSSVYLSLAYTARPNTSQYNMYNVHPRPGDDGRLFAFLKTV